MLLLTAQRESFESAQVCTMFAEYRLAHNGVTEFCEILQSFPQNTCQNLDLYTNNYVYKWQNLAPGIRFEGKSDWISVDKHAGTSQRWCIWGVDYGVRL